MKSDTEGNNNQININESSPKSTHRRGVTVVKKMSFAVFEHI